jgi:hypothetical protein
MGGLFTILKVREGITSYADPGWYENPPGTVANLVSAEQLRADGIEVPSPQKSSGPVTYTCSMHPEIVQDKPGKCPKCGMELVPKQENRATLPSHKHSH